MNEDGYKLVEFDKYCKTCVNKDVDEVKDPCNECLTICENANSHKPIKYVKQESFRSQS